MKVAPQNKTYNKVNIMGVEVSSTSTSSVLTKISQICRISLPKPFFIVTVNPEFVMMAQNDEEFKNILNSADLAIADGVGLKFASSGLEIIPGRVLVQKLCEMSKFKIFYLGGQNGVAEAMAKKYGGAYDDGEKSIRAGELESKRIITKINKYRPDILFVAYGAPYQEKWLSANCQLLSAKVIMGVGGAFDYLTGHVAVPPEWISKIGLEWLWRLVHQPWRWRRQMNLVKFVLLQIFSSRR